MELIIITLGVLVVILIYAIFNLLRKLERLDDELTDVSLTLADVLTSIEQTYNDMKLLDSKQMFESDDEVGNVFKTLKGEVDNLRDKYIGEA
tara:strand:- start:212 stop:487 length:276 start_codon:yes stop_codon:yes gene_type:complete